MQHRVDFLVDSLEFFASLHHLARGLGQIIRRIRGAPGLVELPRQQPAQISQQRRGLFSEAWVRFLTIVRNELNQAPRELLRGNLDEVALPGLV